MLSHEFEMPDTAFERALMLQNMLTSRATGGGITMTIYGEIRMGFMKDASTKAKLPQSVRTCRTENELWSHFKEIASTYQERSDYISQAFQPLLSFLEFGLSSPLDAVVEDALSSYDEAGVRTSWEKALSRRQDDPDGAITAARTLLETVCKHVLDHSGEAYKDDDLPKLYSKTAKLLNLAPSQHTEETVKAILGGCHTVVQNIGTLRNKIGDAHGQGRRPVKAAPRHAALAVNLAGAMATFIIETWNTRNQQAS